MRGTNWVCRRPRRPPGDRRAGIGREHLGWRHVTVLSRRHSPVGVLIPVVSVSALLFLALLGALAAHVGGASVVIGAARITFWGALAMALTAGIGRLLGTVV